MESKGDRAFHSITRDSQNLAPASPPTSSSALSPSPPSVLKPLWCFPCSSPNQAFIHFTTFYRCCFFVYRLLFLPHLQSSCFYSFFILYIRYFFSEALPAAQPKTSPSSFPLYQSSQFIMIFCVYLIIVSTLWWQEPREL